MTQFPSTQPRESNSKIVLIAIVVAIAAFILGNLYVSLVRQQARPGQLTIYRLNTSVEPQDTFDRTMVEATYIPADLEPSFPGAITSRELMLNREGQRFMRRADFQSILTDELFDDRQRNRIDEQLSDGRVDKAIQVNPRRLPGYINKLGNLRVNILAAFDVGGRIEIIPIMERVEVRSIGSITAEDVVDAGVTGPRSLNFSNITIAVTPQQARDLERISRVIVGEFDIQIRNPNDQTVHFQETRNEQINPRALEFVEQARSAERRTGGGFGGIPPRN